jgi:pSer/pThr/pTyr-binding forkhead associated (FHA) protein
MARLIVKTEDGTDTVELKPGNAVGVGRDADNQVPVPSARGASRKHCRITSVPAAGGLAWELMDLGATNRTRVNGHPVERKVLASGDVISVGTAEITFEDPEEEQRLRDAGSKGICYLEWAAGDHKGEKVLLDAPRVSLGRRPSNTIVLDDRMSSGHHAEITRDLNGYTCRDLGSTNGTLVNGEPTTEAALTHGTRVRIGNSRFVFKDPSMKDVEVELAQFEEEDGWGMMGDIDLSRARGSYGGLIVVLLLLGVAGVGGWLLSTQEEGTAAGGPTGATNMIADGDMSAGDRLSYLWLASSDQAPVRIAATKSGANVALSLRHTGGNDETDPVLVSYVQDFLALAQVPWHVRAKLRAHGDAAFVAVWRNWWEPAEGASGAAKTPAPAANSLRLTHTVPLGTGNIDVVAVKPPWAESVVFGVRLGPGASATLDDVSVTKAKQAGTPPQEVSCPGDARAWLNASGGLDVANGLTILVMGARPVVQRADGTVLSTFLPSGPPQDAGKGSWRIEGTFPTDEDPVPASITWSSMETGEGLRAQVQCDGAAAVGLSALMPRAQVGVQMNVLTTQGAGSIQAAAGETAAGVRKTLCGDPTPAPGHPRTLVIFHPVAAAEGNSLAVLDAVDESLLDVRHLSKGTSAAFDMITNFDIQAQAAQEALGKAEMLVRHEPGKGIEALHEISLVYPFMERIRDRATRLAGQADREATAEVAAYRKALSEFRIFRSQETLEHLDAIESRILERYPSRGDADGEHEHAVAEIAAQAKEARASWYAENAGQELTRLERLADLLAGEEGYEPMAAIFYRTIVERFGAMAGDDAFGRRVVRARQEYEKLHAKYGDAIPDVPKRPNH